MRVLMTADTVGGVWTYAMELAAALARHDVSIALATMGARPSSQQRQEAAAATNIELIESSYKLEWMENPWEDVTRAGEWLLELEARVRPNLVHLNGYSHGALAFSAPKIIVAHSCVLSWWQAVKGEPAPAQWNEYGQQVRSGLWAADLVIAPSQAMINEIFRLYGPLPRTRVIHNARQPALFSSTVPKEHFILSAGRLWDEAKNVTALDRVAPLLDWPVYVAGDDRLPGQRSAPPRNLVGLGKLSGKAMARWYARAAIYAHPAKYEPFGLSALEAALSGCALLLGNIPSLREIWGDAATYVSPDNPDAIGAALSDLIRDVPQREALGRSARERAMQYSPARMAQQYLMAYQQMVQQRQARPRRAAQLAGAQAAAIQYPG